MRIGYGGFPRKSVLLMTAVGADHSQTVSWYETFGRKLHWKNLVEVLSAGKTEKAFRLESITK